jgi:RNA polymerase sigma factor (sigma-70 family)
MEDEALVVLIQRHGCFHPAQRVLIERHLDWVRRRVAGYAGRCWFPGAEPCDAQQQAVISMVWAIKNYDPIQEGKKRHCRFRTFLEGVIRKRFLDFVRNAFRAARPGKGSPPLGEIPDPASDPPAALLLPLDAPGGDPARTAQDRELFERLRQVFDQLDAEEQELVREHVFRGRPLRELNKEWGVSYRTLKRRWEGVRARFKLGLEDLAG